MSFFFLLLLVFLSLLSLLGTLFADVGLYDISPWVTELIIFLLSFSMYYSDLLISIKLLMFSDHSCYFQSDIKLVKVNIFISDIIIFHSRFQFASFCTFLSHLRFPISLLIEAIFFFKIFIVSFLLYIYIYVYFNICIYLL